MKDDGVWWGVFLDFFFTAKKKKKCELLRGITVKW